MIKRLSIIIGIMIFLAVYSYLSLLVGDLLDPGKTTRAGMAIMAGLFIIPMVGIAAGIVIYGIIFVGFWIIIGESLNDQDCTDSWWHTRHEKRKHIEPIDKEYQLALKGLDKEFPGATE